MHFYHYVPLEAGPSPPCDPTGVVVELFCNGFAPVTSSVDLIWMWTPQQSTPFTEVDIFSPNGWVQTSSSNLMTSGPYTGYDRIQSDLTFGFGVTTNIMGYYA